MDRQRRERLVTSAIAVAALAPTLGLYLLFSSWEGGEPESDPVSTGCIIDTRTLRTAQMDYFDDPSSGNGRYASMDRLVELGLLSAPSTLHAFAFGPEARTFAVLVAHPRCGTLGHTVGQTPDDR